MSLVVLNSQGQDPADFENHFGRGLRLPENAEICLCGVNLNKGNQQNGVVETNVNDALVVQLGDGSNSGTGANNQKYSPYSPIFVRAAPGYYQPEQLAEELSEKFAGNGAAKRLSNPASCWAYGNATNGTSFCFYDAGQSKMVLRARRSYVFQEAGNYIPGKIDAGVIYTSNAHARERYIGTCGSGDRTLLGNSGTSTGTGAGSGFEIVVSPLDPTYVRYTPSEGIQAVIMKDPIWNGCVGAGFQQPTANADAVFGGAPRISPIHELGVQFLLQINTNVTFEYLKTLRGGIFRGSRCGIVNPAGAFNRTDAYNQGKANRQHLQQNWAVGGAKYDLFWKVLSFDPAASANGTYNVGIFYMPTTNDGDEVYDESKAIKVGEGEWEAGTAGAPNTCGVIFRPVDGTSGTSGANAPAAPVAADQSRCCWDFRIVQIPTASLGAATPGSVKNATTGGAPGYKSVTDGGDFDIYKEAPLYAGCTAGHGGFVPPPAAPIVNDGRIDMKFLAHNQRVTNIQNMSNLNGAGAPVSAPKTLQNMQFSFLGTTFAFSPQTYNLNAGVVKPALMQMSRRHANIAGSIGFIQNKLHFLTSANTTAGLQSDANKFNPNGWTINTGVCVVQLPNLPIDGELGGGNNVYGGANSANILGVVGLHGETNNEIDGIVYREPSLENYVKLKNINGMTINQLKVKLTDVTGRKLQNLQPESTIWIKIRSCGKDKVMKTGGVNPIPHVMHDMSYRNL